MNEKIKSNHLKLEYANFCVLVFVFDSSVPHFEMGESSNDTEYNDTEYIKIYNKIHQYIVTEKHFLDKDITVNVVVRQCGVKKKSLNKILRLKENMAFHAYVNKQRVIYASTLLLDPSNELIEVIALEASFNNTRTFVRNFKAVYNMTPSEYRRRNGFKKS